LEGVSKQAIWHRLEPKTQKYFEAFKICRGCDRIFWQGSHHEQMRRRLRRAGVDSDVPPPDPAGAGGASAD
jgi:uncharacterized protein with PIN domain